MATNRAPTLPPHTMRLLVTQCIASGLTAQEFGRRNGITVEQAKRLAGLITQEINQTGRTTAHGSIVPQNQAHSLQKLGNRLFNALVGQGTRAAEALERQNARYEPRMVNGELLAPDFSPEDIRLSKWALSVCSVIMAFVRKDGRDQAPSPVDPEALEPIQRTMDAQPAGMLTVIQAPATDVQGEQSAT